jgi:HSP20 family protein
LRDELDRLFESPFEQFASSQMLGADIGPALDLYEDKDNLTVSAELPGMKREEIEVSLHDGALTISGERKSEKNSEKGQAYRSERFFGRFQRTVALPSSVAADKVKATYKDGILTVTLPKTEEAKPKQIDVNVS